MTRLVMITLAVIVNLGCSHSLKYVSFGAYQPEVAERVESNYSAIAKGSGPAPEEGEVMVLRGTLPPGVTLANGTISAAPDSGMTVLGTFEWHGGGMLPTETAGARELAKIAKIAGGNILVLMDVNSRGGYLRAAAGIVIRATKRQEGPPREMQSF